MAETINTKVTKKPKNVYISNPFTLCFRALSRFFSVNQGWAIALLILGLLSFLNQIGVRSTPASSSTTSPAITASHDANVVIAKVIVIVVTVIAVFIFVSIIAIFIQGILSYVALENEAGNQVGLKEAYQATRARFGRLYWAELLAIVKIFGWALLFIIPGIVAALRYALLPYVIMDEPADATGIKDSHARIKGLVKKRLPEVFGIAALSSIPIIGTLLGLGGEASLYNQLKVYTDKKLEKPKIHWLNYLAIGLVIIVIIATTALDLRKIY